MLKQAFAQGQIDTPEAADIWLALLQDRNLTTHTYREDMPETIAAHTRSSYAAALHDMAMRMAGLSLD